MAERITIRKLATELSLSRSTVQRALAGLASVSPETRRKVLHAAVQHGYGLFRTGEPISCWGMLAGAWFRRQAGLK